MGSDDLSSNPRAPNDREDLHSPSGVPDPVGRVPEGALDASGLEEWLDSLSPRLPGEPTSEQAGEPAVDAHSLASAATTGEPHPGSGSGGFARMFWDGLLAMSGAFRKSDVRGERAASGRASSRSDTSIGQRPGSTSVGSLVKDANPAVSGVFRHDPESNQQEISPAAQAQRQPQPRLPNRPSEVWRVPEAITPIEPVGPMAPDLATIVSFAGELLYKDVKPSTHVVQAGDTLESIAANHIPAASNDEVALHVAEIQRLNELVTGEPLSEGRRLILPGHTSDGGTVLRDAAGALHTHWPDGVQRLDRGDGTGYVRRPTPDGGVSEKHWGPGPEDNYDLTRAPDGHYRLREHSGAEAVVPAHHRRVVRARWTTATEVDAAHQAAAALYGRLDLIEQRLDRGSRNDTAAFENLRAIRAHTQELEVRARRDGLPPGEVARTYRELDQMLRSETTAPTSAGDRLRLAADVSRQAARPEAVNQGRCRTGAVAAIETRMYMINPAAAASLVREVATTGHFTESDRTVVQVLPESQASFQPDGDTQRSFASQLFQVTAVNIHWAHHDLTDGQGRTIARAGRIRYEQHAPGTSPDGEPDSGERLMDYSHAPVRSPREICQPGEDASRPIAHPRLIAGDLTEISNRICGRSEEEILVVNAAEDLPRVIRFETEPELEGVLADLKAQQRFPVIMEVNSGSQPFFGILGGDAAGGAEGTHFITLSGCDPVARTVQFCNPWSLQLDRIAQSSVGLRELYLSSVGCRSRAQAAAPPEQRVSREDWPALMALLWRQRTSGAVSPDRFIQGFAGILNEAHMLMMREWTPETRAAHHDLEIEFCKVFARLPIEEQEAVALQLDRAAAMSLLSTVEQMYRES